MTFQRKQQVKIGVILEEIRSGYEAYVEATFLNDYTVMHRLVGVGVLVTKEDAY